MLLLRLLRTFLGKYRRELALVFIFTVVQVMCTLFLPTLNADIIDNGVLKGDTSYIWHVGLLMLGVTFVQVVFAVIAVYFGARVAMAFGRDVRQALFHRVTGFSTQDVARFGAPSLITRITNDVTQVQILVLMSCTLLIAAPITIVGGIIMALREDGPLTLILLVSIPILLLAIGTVISRMVPQFQVMQVRIDRINEILREQITGMRVVRAFVREPEEADRFADANADITADVTQRRPAHGVHVPDGDVGGEHLERGGSVDRRQPDRRRRNADRRARRVPQLPHSDPDVGDDGHVRRGAHAARRSERRSD